MAGGTNGWNERLWILWDELRRNQAEGSGQEGVRIVSDQLYDISIALSQISEQNERIIMHLNQLTELEDD